MSCRAAAASPGPEMTQKFVISVRDLVAMEAIYRVDETPLKVPPNSTESLPAGVCLPSSGGSPSLKLIAVNCKLFAGITTSIALSTRAVLPNSNRRHCALISSYRNFLNPANVTLCSLNVIQRRYICPHLAVTCPTIVETFLPSVLQNPHPFPVHYWQRLQVPSLTQICPRQSPSQVRNRAFPALEPRGSLVK